ncbi:hypothetical protein NPIL_591971 [Nephila pilipes]|uniref:Uncharacterized protein n=1 Tax=Nephila pilipes TaxID=299642 RepID=A0A8X6U3N8_NEPPI|nr:hypothetical protein NPIL_591971 [Nephila pilipes]
MGGLKTPVTKDGKLLQLTCLHKSNPFHFPRPIKYINSSQRSCFIIEIKQLSLGKSTIDSTCCSIRIERAMNSKRLSLHVRVQRRTGYVDLVFNLPDPSTGTNEDTIIHHKLTNPSARSKNHRVSKSR